MKALIGSKALTLHSADWMFGEGIGRDPRDTDILATFDDIQEYHKSLQLKACYPFNGGKKYFAQDTKGNIYESEIAWEGSNSEKLLELIRNDPKTITSPFAPNFLIPSLNVLYMLKMSHRYLKNSPHFLKTMEDIHWMREKGAFIEPAHEEFYKERMAVTYDYGHPKLNQDKKNFFTDDVPYQYDHDSIHEAVKVMHQPAYMFFKPADSEVMVSKAMWDNLDYDIKLLATYEESCVLALERSLIPFPNGKTPKEAFDMALMKVCTSITSGWFREFSWEAYRDVQSLYNYFELDQYHKRFAVGLVAGVVKPYKEG